MRRGTAIITGVILVTLAVFGWRAFFPNQERLVRKRLLEMSRLLSFPANEAPLAKFANSQKLAGFFTSDVEVVVDAPGVSRQTISGREDLLQGALGVRNHLSALQVDLPDIAVIMGPGKRTAIANVTVMARISGEKDLFVQEMSIQLVRPGGTWLIKHAKTTNTLR
jgi:hypothetical protein